MHNSSVVRLEHIAMKYQTESGEVEAVSDVSFSVRRGEFLSIVGPSGCGKSTLLSIIAGLAEQSAGCVTVLGQPAARGARSVGYMLQKDHLFEWRTIEQNVLLGLEVRRDLNDETRAAAQELLRTYDLWEFRDRYPRELSGGMRQRAALIRTLATSPDILLLDEAFSALDYQTRLTVTEDIHGIIKQVGATAILVTHDISESIALSDRVVVLSARPAVVQAIHEIDLGDLTSGQRRDHPDFRNYFNLVRKELGLNGA